MLLPSTDLDVCELFKISLFIALVIFISKSTSADIRLTSNNYEIHYSIVPTLFLSRDVSRQYSITRAKDRSFLNLSIKDPLGKSVNTQLSGSRSNLLGQSVELNFKEIQEADVIYYIANIKHGKEEHLKFSIQLQLSSERMEILEFSKKMYWGEK